MRRQFFGALALFTLIVIAGDAGVSQTGFKFESDTRARLIRMIHREPTACVDLIERAESLAGLRDALVKRLRTQYTRMKIVEAARTLRDLDLSEDMTLRELREAAGAVEPESDEL